MRSVLLYESEFSSFEWYIVDGDWTRFENVYINSAPPEGSDGPTYDMLVDELESLLYEMDDQEKYGDKKLAPVSKDKAVQAIREGCPLVLCGFVP